MLKTWQHWINWWTSWMKNQPMSPCLSTHHTNMYFKMLQKHISSTTVYLTKKKSNPRKITTIDTRNCRVKTSMSTGLAEEFYRRNNYINLSDWLKEINYHLQILRIKINWCLTFTNKETKFWGNDFLTNL